jgi:uncharacterized coiled-coil protein SlyX
MANNKKEDLARRVFALETAIDEFKQANDDLTDALVTKQKIIRHYEEKCKPWYEKLIDSIF